ncbi:hypothetical protein [Sebaldella sp. S0638]|uniref:hypothetical protein n=1 Tax=Sebaldella sp. S0638 TaxID=2957809 RepID=UPI0020A18870|nr:hypothetical protein [Sebaldella sp. S0638]MCP1226456.1 hypothetical protein [Sebaldella sp. S0638]
MIKTCKIKTRTNFYIIEDGIKGLFRESLSETEAEIEFIKYFSNKIAVQIEIKSKESKNVNIDNSTKLFFDKFDEPGRKLNFILNDKNELEKCINLDEIAEKWETIKKSVEINEEIEQFIFQMDKMYKNKKILNETTKELYFLPYFFRDYTDGENIIKFKKLLFNFDFPMKIIIQNGVINGQLNHLEFNDVDFKKTVRNYFNLSKDKMLQIEAKLNGTIENRNSYFPILDLETVIYVENLLEKREKIKIEYLGR